jgi:alpha-L-fucosidase
MLNRLNVFRAAVLAIACLVSVTAVRSQAPDTAQNAAAAQAPPVFWYPQPLTADPPPFEPYVPPPQKAPAMVRWRAASFGLFLHFGVYSTFGGEYEGKRSGAYGEWLMHDVKIPLAEYRKKVAGVFNPTEFNADEWVRIAKDTGMRYLVVTSKHHDGFAMWNSQVSDYNVVKATPFGRDVIGELRDACRKQGILFGVYYSQSHDWSHPGGQNNTWDFPWEPTQSNWWRTSEGKRNLQWAAHFERSSQYVREKALPQLEELITGYDPDIIWWDTGAMLPYELARSMFDRANELKPSIVMDARNGAYYNGESYYDYQSTPDKPRYFRPRTGYWEAIPTTNESYGYNKWDKSYKDPTALINLLAEAASKGGNVLLDVGPMGNGKFAPEDMQVLEGIGRWMKVNGEAIYGADRTPLPVQPWGTSALKGNELYLFVFNSPADGKLVVGDLQSDPGRAVLLGAGNSRLPIRRLDANFVEITLPAAAQKTVTPVVKLTLKDPVKTGGALPVSITQPSEYRIYDAQLSGGVGYGDETYWRAGSTGWTSPQGRVSWEVVARRGGSYKVSVTYNRAKGIGGGEFQVSIAGQSFKRDVETGTMTPTVRSKGDVVTREMGVVKIPAGREELAVEAVTIPPDQELMRFISVTLTPAGS